MMRVGVSLSSFSYRKEEVDDGGFREVYLRSILLPKNFLRTPVSGKFPFWQDFPIFCGIIWGNVACQGDAF